ncbi:hypothetical protein CSUI_008297 [Cystoisospora suis]|uniref:Uncharacterized protein n=1 Tax=Cystoisospora suis TaxID=483139 RepID=A0A2C6KN22_9APIC|nr:hypothetical protein CSUI_008297 [Cystoisospora suis]
MLGPCNANSVVGSIPHLWRVPCCVLGNAERLCVLRFLGAVLPIFNLCI